MSWHNRESATNDPDRFYQYYLYLEVHLLLVDELGFTPFDKMEEELLFNLLAIRYERRSTIVTTMVVQVFGSKN